MHDDKRTKIFEQDAEPPTLLKYEKMIKEIKKDYLLSTCFPNMINKLAKARKMRKPPGKLSLKKFGLGNLWVKILAYLQYTFGKYTFGRYTFGKYTFGRYTFKKYTFKKYTFRKYTFRKYTFGKYTFGKYTFGKYTFGKYTFGKYTFGKYTFGKYTKIIGVLSLQLFT